MISLRLKIHLRLVRVQVVEEGEDLPETESDALALQFVLEQFGVNFLLQEQIRRHYGQLVWVASIPLKRLDVLPDFFLELLFECQNAAGSTLN